MSSTTSHYDLLLKKLDEFIRKYYKNQLIRGLLYAGGLVLSGFLAVALLEYFARFDTTVRTVLFWGFLAAAGAVLARLVLVPLFRLNRIGKIISHEQAAGIIGTHFSNVQDKLLNVLQLHQSAAAPGVSRDLIEASINQKINELRPVPFTAAIDLRQNRKYAKYVAIPLLVIAVIFFTNASLLTESTNRLVNHGQYFEKEMPFKITVLNKKLETAESEDYKLDIKLSGAEIPETVTILVGENEYKLNRESTINFSYVFRNVQKTQEFRLSADGFTSAPYTLNVLANPIVLNFDVELVYPAYTGRKNETLRNTGDLSVPAGTQIRWKFSTRATRQMKVRMNDSLYALKPTADNRFNFAQRVLQSRTYTLHTANEFLSSKDSMRYSINVIPDLYPGISVTEKRDTSSALRLQFTGDVKDDYGFTSLNFRYRTLNATDSAGKTASDELRSVSLPLNRGQQRDQFYYFWDLSRLDIQPGQQIEYYFEVYDNDAVFGAKATRSQRMIYQAPTKQQLSDMNDAGNKEVEKALEESLKESQQLQKDIDELYKKLMEKKTMSWEERKKLDELTQRQQQLQQKIDNLKQQNQQNINQQQEFQQSNPQQDQMSELFDQLNTDEMKKLLDQMEKLQQLEMNKQQTQKMLDQMKQENTDTRKNLDRTLELFRQMQVEQKLDNAIQELNDIQQKQDSLAKLSEQNKAPAEELKKGQDSLNKRFDELRKELDELQELNEKLESPNELPNTDVQEMEIQQQQRQSSQQLQNNSKPGKASPSQKKASDQMQQLSQQLQQAQQEMQESKEGEDMKAIRTLLDNLLQLSFDQEALMKEVKQTSVNDPKYPALARKQSKLRDDARMIEDSLLALSKRNPKISPKVNEEVTNINSNMERSVQNLADRSSAEAQNRQQQAMTSVNNLALMLNESLEQMMQQMSQSKSQKEGNGECNKPGDGKKPGQGKKNKPGQGKQTGPGKGDGKGEGAEGIRMKQQSINQRINRLQQQQQNGQPLSAEELARLAAEQEALRRMLEESLKNGKGKETPGAGGAGDLPSKMEETENDLVNKRINAETLKRQQEIINKLLEYEKAEKEREQDEQREAQQPKNEAESNPADFLEYNRQKQKEAELLKTVPPALSPFYKGKVNEYFNGVEQQ
ncbi:MAG: DUF4175 family protein [Bacteroidia bacterium]|jgi:hypothetical protein|nr:DUF4175 family protein [Bacteroidia bacterium]